jgi:hypothetical protein
VERRPAGDLNLSRAGFGSSRPRRVVSGVG